MLGIHVLQVGGVPSTEPVTAGQHVGDRENREEGGGGGPESRGQGRARGQLPAPHSCGKSEVRGLRLLGKV